MKKSKNTISYVVLRNMIVITFVAIVTLGLAMIGDEIYQYLQDSSILRKEYIDIQKATIKAVVEKAVEEIDHWKSFSEKTSLKISKDEITEAVFKRLTTIAFGKNSEGFIFVGNFDGVELVNGKYPHLVGKNFWEMEDAFGVNIFQEEIRIAKTNPKGDFLKYWWSGKHDSKGAIPKISFIKGVKDWKLFVGAGMNMNEVDEIIAQKKNEVIREVKHHIIVICIGLILLSFFGLWLSRRISERVRKNIDTFSSFFNRASTDGTPINLYQVHYSEFEYLASSANRMIEERMKIEGALQIAFERFTIVMDALDNLVYVSDLQTYEVLFLNKYGRTVWGDSVGEKCWKTLQSGQTGPCEFSPMISSLMPTANQEAYMFGNFGIWWTTSGMSATTRQFAGRTDDMSGWRSPLTSPSTSKPRSI